MTNHDEQCSGDVQHSEGAEPAEPQPHPYSAQFNGPNGVFSVSGDVFDEAARRCGVKFNPGGHLATDMVKGFCTAAMRSVMDERDRMCEKARGSEMTEADSAAHSDMMRCMATALTHLEAAQMFAVKGLHTRANAGLSD